MHFQQLIPMLCVSDVAASVAFYKDALGFDFVSPQSKFEEAGVLQWCMIQSGDVKLMLTGGEDGADDEPDNADRRAGRSQAMLYFYPDDVMPLYASLKAAGRTVTAPRVTFYGMKEIVVEDPDGYTLYFGSPTDEPVTPEQ